MNELYGIAPNACTTATELRLLMSAFGPAAGKYILAYPKYNAWRNFLFEANKDMGDIEKHRFKVVLERAQANHALVERGDMSWQDHLDWTRNALNEWGRSAQFKKIYLSDGHYEQLMATDGEKALTKAMKISDVAPFSSSGCQVDATASSYWETAKLLCLMSREIHFIDPFFNPAKVDRRKILEVFFPPLLKSSRPRSISIWLRDDQVLEWDQVHRQLIRLVEGSNEQSSVSVFLVDDARTRDKLHARYLVTEKGGINFDQGFQELGRGKVNTLSPLSTDLHRNIFSKFSTKNFDFSVAKELHIGP